MTIDAAARWMADILERDGMLYQDVAVSYISDNFEAELASIKANGNPSISPAVLRAFNALTPNAVWSKGGRFWRRREDYDLPGRQQP